jgi:hypothetical protein
MTKRTTQPLEPTDAEIASLLEDAAKQYERYREIVEIADVAAVIADPEPAPPPEDVPLSLTVWPARS